MKLLNGYRMRLVLIGFVAAIVHGDGGSANADFTFGTPTNLGPTVNSVALDKGPSISNDGLTLFFHSGSNRPGGYGQMDLWVTTRATIDDPWSAPVNLGPNVNSSYHERDPSISADGLSLYFSSNRPGGSGDFWHPWDLWVTTRATTDEPWSTPVILGPTVNSWVNEFSPSISADGLSLYFSSNLPGVGDNAYIWVTTRATVSDPWGEPVRLGPNINSSASSAWEQDPALSADGLALFFCSERPPGKVYDGGIWVTTRATVSDPWGEPVWLVPPVGIEGREEAPAISADGMLLYFVSNWPGGFGHWDIWQVPILPVVDLNGDGKVDVKDVVIMTEHWGENYSLCDIGPTPLGDGIVDVQDLVVLTEYMEPKDRTLIAHWALDEIEGDIASNSANDNDGTVYGDPAWQPDGGIVDGSLQFDGIDDYVSTNFVLNPTAGPFSVFAWVKGGVPGQAVLSQMGGARWLCADPSEGNLMTELKGTGRDTNELLSQTVITHGNWHRIGFVWDGSHRMLYVDDIAVAEDAQTNLVGLDNGLYIGAGKAMEPGSYWSGLIDDVHIYNRAVIP